MTIVEKIINSIQSAVMVDYGHVDSQGDPVLDPIEVYYHDEATLNLMTSQMAFPCALFQLLTTGNAVQEGGQVKERVTAAVFFVEKSEFDFDAVDNEAIIDRCKRRAFAWLQSISGGTDVTLANLNRTARVYDQYDDIVTGFGLFVDLVEVTGLCITTE